MSTSPLRNVMELVIGIGRMKIPGRGRDLIILCLLLFPRLLLLLQLFIYLKNRTVSKAVIKDTATGVITDLPRNLPRSIRDI